MIARDSPLYLQPEDVPEHGDGDGGALVHGAAEHAHPHAAQHGGYQRGERHPAEALPATRTCNQRLDSKEALTHSKQKA